MASITTNGVILEVPYAIIRNIRTSRPWTLAVVGRDPRQYAYNQQQLRSLPATPAEGSRAIFVYRGDVITFSIPAPCADATAAAFDLYSVNFTTGVETKAAEVGFNAVWQTQVKVTLSAINASSGAITFTTAWS
jgi:hypothetical protein